MGYVKMKPLRKILWENTVRGVEWEFLECGHQVLRKHDHYGHFKASSRRCGKCEAGKPQDFDPETIREALK